MIQKDAKCSFVCFLCVNQIQMAKTSSFKVINELLRWNFFDNFIQNCEDELYNF